MQNMQFNAWMDERIDGCMVECMNSQMDGQMDGNVAGYKIDFRWICLYFRFGKFI